MTKQYNVMNKQEEGDCRQHQQLKCLEGLQLPDDQPAALGALPEEARTRRSVGQDKFDLGALGRLVIVILSLIFLTHT